MWRSRRTFWICPPRTSSASLRRQVEHHLAQNHPDHLPPPNGTCRPVATHLEDCIRKVLRQRREKDIPQPAVDVRVIRGSRTQPPPNLFQAVAAQSEYPARQVAPRSDSSSVPTRSKAWSASCNSSEVSPRCSLITASARSRSRSSSHGSRRPAEWRSANHA